MKNQAEKKLIDFKEGDLQSFWSARIRRAIAFREKVIGDTWKENRELLLAREGMELGDEFKSAHFRAIVNLLWHIIRTYLPTLYLDDPYILVRLFDRNADQAELEKKAQWFEGLLNEFKVKMRTKKHTRSAILDALLYSFGVIKLGWTHLSYHTAPTGKEGRILSFELHKRRRDVSSPFLARVSPINFLVDPEASSFDRIKWVAERIIVPAVSFLRNPVYQEAGKKLNDVALISAGSILKRMFEEEATETEEERVPPELTSSTDFLFDKYVVLWECTTLEDDVFMTFAEASQSSQGEKTSPTLILIRKGDRPYKDVIDGLHYHILTFNEVPDTLYPPSDIELVKEFQRQLNWIRSHQLSRMEKYRSIYLVDKDAFDEIDLERIENAEDNAIIPVQGLENVRDAIHLLESRPINPQIFDIQETISREMWETAGISPAARGLIMKGETATAVGAREEYIDVRLNDRVLIIKSWLEDIFWDVANLIAHYYSGQGKGTEFRSLAVPIETAEGKYEVLEYRFEDIPEMFKISLEVSNTFPYRRDVELTNFLRAVNLLANNPFVSQREIALRTFEMFRLRHIDRLVPSAVIPPVLIEFLQSNPELLANLLSVAQAEQMKQRNLLDANFPGNVPVGEQGTQGGMR